MLLTLASITIGYYVVRRLFRYPARNRDIKLACIWLIVAFQVGMFAFTWLPHVDLAKYPLLPPTQLTDFLRRDPSSRLFVDRRSHPNEQYLFIDNENAAYGIPVISGFESLLPRSFYLAVPHFASDSTMPAKLLGLLNVKYILTGPSSHLPGDEFQLIDSGKWRLWMNEMPVRRVWISDHIIDSPNDSITLSKLMGSSYDPRDVIFSNENHQSLPLRPATSIAKATITEEEPESVSIETSCEHPGYLILSDTYYPGWKSFVDGRESEIHRANYAMRAVYLEPGQHNVQFVFDPISFRIGALISLISLVGVLSLGVGMILRRNSSRKRA
jgi:hypothetical protein